MRRVAQYTRKTRALAASSLGTCRGEVYRPSGKDFAISTTLNRADVGDVVIRVSLENRVVRFLTTPPA
jgi:hypothetical protein